MLTPQEANRLAALEQRFEDAGGRGVDLAEEIDALRLKGVIPLTVTIFYVGATPSEALESLPFDSDDSAQSYLDDQGPNHGLHVYSVQAVIDPSSVSEVSE